MKILVAHKYMFRGGGTATYLFALWEQLEVLGHEVVPFTVAYSGTVPTAYQEYYVSPPFGDAVTHFAHMKLPPWSALRLLGRALWSTEAYRKALALVAASKPDVAYVHNLYSYMSPSPIAAFRKSGLPIVMRVPDMNMVCAELHGFRRDSEPCLECVRHGPWRALRYRCHKGSWKATAARSLTMWYHNLSGVYRLVDLFITPSAFMRDLLIEAGFDGDRISHVPSFYEAPDDADEPPHEANPPYILSFGRVSREKGLDVLVRAARLLPEGVQVLVAGGDVDGELGRLERLAAELDVGNLRFLGFQNKEQLAELVRGALFTVVPSRWYDNCPMSVLESFARSKPVVGANIGGIPEQITGDCGLLFTPGDDKELAEKMTWLIDRPEDRRAMGAAARERLRSAFGARAHCDRLLGIFGELIGRS